MLMVMPSHFDPFLLWESVPKMKASAGWANCPPQPFGLNLNFALATVYRPAGVFLVIPVPVAPGK